MQIENNANLCVTIEGEVTNLDAHRSVRRNIDPESMIDIVKTADKASAFIGEIITYTVKIEVEDIGVTVLETVFSDTLNDYLELVDGSVKVDGVSVESDLSNIPISLSANQVVEIEYQCKML